MGRKSRGHTIIHSSIIHESQKVETTQTCMDEWKDKQNVVNTMERH